MPRVSIGLPVRNGQKYLTEAIESVLSQTFTDLELIISDNASTDATPEICRAFARRDARVRYERFDANVGAARNFNRVLELAQGEYFKWVAHDDACAPEFLSRCVKVLDGDQSMVLCHPRTSIIDEHSRFLDHYDLKLQTDAPQPHVRLRALTRGHQCYEIFGLIRADALRAIGGLGDYVGGDAVVLVRLALRGRFHEVPKALLYRRTHAEQSELLRSRPDVYAIWWNPANSNRIMFPYWRIAREYFKSVRDASVSRYERMVCRLHVARWCLRRWRHLGRDVIRAIRRKMGMSDETHRVAEAM